MTPQLFTDSFERQLCAGPLKPYIRGFATVLGGLGYAPATAREKLQLIADLGRWLDRRRLRVTDLDEEKIRTYLQNRHRRGRVVRSHAVTAAALLNHLRTTGVVCPVTVKHDDSPILELERAFAEYLTAERGLSAGTQINYVSEIHRFLLEQFGTGPVKLTQLCFGDISRFVVQQSRRVSPGRAKLTVTALRSFLRWLYRRGDLTMDLGASIPPVANWRHATLPKSIPTQQVEQVLLHCDRHRAVGIRDYAILLLLARLGLRGGEVARLNLDDLDWQAGEMTIRGKRGRQDRLPLPQDVGQALAEYLRDARPRCSTRRVFVCAKAPVRGFASTVAICTIVKRALDRAGLHPAHKGAHLLRHSLACTMLRRGASLPEIGEILRHHSPDTTALYAKVDLMALRALAPAWPGGDQ